MPDKYLYSKAELDAAVAQTWERAIEIVKHQIILNEDIPYGSADATIAHTVEKRLKNRIIDALGALKAAV